jgi:uncharacterized protein YdiU (UPF0061 family)
MSIAGETIDYGPCAFMEAYDPATVFSSIDSSGRYAYGNQPAICQWNLARFAESLLMLIDSDQKRAIESAKELLESFPETFENYWLYGMRRKLGLTDEEPEDRVLATTLLENMERTEADFTNTFRDLTTINGFSPQLAADAQMRTWLSRWQARRARGTVGQQSARSGNVQLRFADPVMLGANPAVIPRNQKVEEALAAATTDHDFGPFKRLLAVLEVPYSDRDVDVEYRTAASKANGYRTFCGT